ncbi:hypothetical protein ACWIG4_32645 [Streptomyces sp. NPDC002248]
MAEQLTAARREAALPAWAPPDWTALDNACCLRGWETRGADHNLTTRIHQEPTR